MGKQDVDELEWEQDPEREDGKVAPIQSADRERLVAMYEADGYEVSTSVDTSGQMWLWVTPRRDAEPDRVGDVLFGAERILGVQGNTDLRAVVEQALALDPRATAKDVADIWREAEADWAAERAHEAAQT